MSFNDRNIQLLSDREYQLLKDQRAKIEGQVSTWVQRATALHVATPDAGEKAEVIAVRDEFVANLRSILGV